MHRIAEHAFDGILPQERKKQSRFDVLQCVVLFRSLQAVKASQVFQPLAIDLLWRRFALIAEFRWSIVFKWPLEVAIAVSSPRPSKLPVDVDSDTCFLRPGTCLVAREDSPA